MDIIPADPNPFPLNHRTTPSFIPPSTPKKTTGTSPEPSKTTSPITSINSEGPAPIPAMRRSGVLALKRGMVRQGY